MTTKQMEYQLKEAVKLQSEICKTRNHLDTIPTLVECMKVIQLNDISGQLYKMANPDFKPTMQH